MLLPSLLGTCFGCCSQCQNRAKDTLDLILMESQGPKALVVCPPGPTLRDVVPPILPTR